MGKNWVGVLCAILAGCAGGLFLWGITALAYSAQFLRAVQWPFLMGHNNMISSLHWGRF
mgnify:CR=1 FL=1